MRLVPDELWSLAAPLLPAAAPAPPRTGPPGRDERTVFTAVVYVLASECAWRHLPDHFEVSPATARRHFSLWTRAGLWRRLRQTAQDEAAARDEPAARGELDWISVIVDAAAVRAGAGEC
jgi:transposase